MLEHTGGVLESFDDSDLRITRVRATMRARSGEDAASDAASARNSPRTITKSLSMLALARASEAGPAATSIELSTRMRGAAEVSELSRNGWARAVQLSVDARCARSKFCKHLNVCEARELAACGRHGRCCARRYRRTRRRGAPRTKRREAPKCPVPSTASPTWSVGPSGCSRSVKEPFEGHAHQAKVRLMEPRRWSAASLAYEATLRRRTSCWTVAKSRYGPWAVCTVRSGRAAYLRCVAKRSHPVPTRARIQSFADHRMYCSRVVFIGGAP